MTNETPIAEQFARNILGFDGSDFRKGKPIFARDEETHYWGRTSDGKLTAFLPNSLNNVIKSAYEWVNIQKGDHYLDAYDTMTKAFADWLDRDVVKNQIPKDIDLANRIMQACVDAHKRQKESEA